MLPDFCFVFFVLLVTHDRQPHSLLHTERRKKWVPHPHRISTGRDVCLSSAGRMLFLKPCSSLAYLCLSAQVYSCCSMNTDSFRLTECNFYQSQSTYSHICFLCVCITNFLMFVGGCGSAAAFHMKDKHCQLKMYIVVNCGGYISGLQKRYVWNAKKLVLPTDV